MQTRRMIHPFAAECLWLIAAAVAWAPIAPAQTNEEPVAAFDKLEQQCAKSFEGKDYAKALALAEEMNAQVEPQHIEALYQIARAHCLLGHKIEAYEWLQRTVDAGFWDVRRLLGDNDFASLRGEKSFGSIVRGTWANGYIAMLERDERDEFQKPAQVMEALALKPGERVADVGAGSGYFTIPVARAVGSTGVVWAIDTSQEMLDYLERRTEAEQLENVKLVKVGRDDPQLEPGGVDTILMVDTIHYIQDRTAYARKLRAGLASGGRLVIIDYRPKPWAQRPWGPPPEQQIPRETLDAELTAAGLVPIKVYDFLPEQYFVVYHAK